jgi:hypothetical protein
VTEADWPDREDTNDEKTAKLIFEHAKDSPSDQLRDSEQLDTKTTAVFTAATVLSASPRDFPKGTISCGLSRET